MNFKEKDEDEFLFIKPKDGEMDISKSGGGEDYDKEKHKKLKEEVAERQIDEKFRATASSIKSKEIVDPQNMYFVIQMAETAPPSKRNTVLKRFSRKVHEYLDATHNVLLVSVSPDFVSKYEERNLPFSIKEILLDIRELRYNEQISKEILEDVEWDFSARPIILHIIPNLDEEISERYLAEITRHLEGRNAPILWKSKPNQGMLLTKINKKNAEDLLKKSNVIFKLEALPIGIASDSSNKRFRVRGRSSSVKKNSRFSFLPSVCIMDTGVNTIPKLSGLLQRDKYPSFVNLDDSDPEKGHGTPIACLVAFGEQSNIPRAKIISYKIFSDQNNDDAFEGMRKAIELYSSKCKIFTSSIVFEENALSAYSKLDALIQRENICFVSSSGNILLDEVTPSQPYPNYIVNFPVLYPAQIAHVIGVGAITRKEKSGSIAPKDALSPFTRCGKNLQRLYDSKKPDVVEHGGNVCHNGDSEGIGVSTFCKDGQASDHFVGTSFSAPLVAGRLAEIIAKYGNRIRNSETLKAILFMSCDSRNSVCVGQGIPRRFLSVNKNYALFIAEGNIRLSDLTQKGKEKKYYQNVEVWVPTGVGRIDMCLVHSDNYNTISEPSVNTYLRVNAWKTGREKTPAPPNNASEQKTKAYVKFLRWGFKRHSMEGLWRFHIFPESTEFIDYSTRKNVMVRYGCAILLTVRQARLNSISLTDIVRRRGM